MQTKEALTRFLQKCEERELSLSTRRHYQGYLRHFAEEYPELPTDTKTIELFLKKRKETPAYRGTWFKMLQAFYSYLEEFEGIKSPVPPKGRVGRPQKVKSVTNPLSTEGEVFTASHLEKLVTGGSSVSTSTSISTQEVVEKFITQRHHLGLRPRTFGLYWDVFKPFIRQYPVLPLRPGPLEEFIDSIQVTPDTKHRYQRTLKSLYIFLEKRYGVPNPTKLMTMVKVPRKVRRTITLDQYKQMLQLPMSFHDKTLIMLIADTGLRAGEIINLRREDVVDGYITLKGKTGEYQVPVSAEVEDMLVQLAPSGYLFHGPKGRLHYTYIHRLMRGLLDQLGITDTKKGPHMLRHSFATLYLERGGDLMSLSQILGHTKVTTTQVYAHLRPEQLRVRHKQASPIRELFPDNHLERAICYGCNQVAMIPLDKVKGTKCPNCGQVGMWYLPNHRGEEVEP